MTTVRRRRPAVGAALVLACAAGGCAPRVAVSLPTGTGRPEASVEAPLAAATTTCAATQVLSGELHLAGRVRGQQIRGKVLSGSTAAGQLRMEGIAPFGAPVFVLVASNEQATLLFPREARVLPRTPTADVLEALVNLPLSAADLHALIAGCGLADRAPTGGRTYDGGWLAVDVGPEATIFLRETGGTWRIEGVRVAALSVGYSAFEGQAPREIRIVSADGSGANRVSLLVRLAALDINPELPPDAFTLDVPADARPLTLAELRGHGMRLGGT
jgi:hypothetical protein